MSPVTARELVRRSSQAARVLNDPDATVSQVARLQDAPPGSLAFAMASRQPDLTTCTASIVVTDLPESLLENEPAFEQRTWILVPQPRLFLAEVADVFDPPPPPRLDARAIVSEEARLGAECAVAPGAVIEAGAVLGARCRIGANAVIGTNVTLGADVHVGPGSVLGGVGFGLARAEAGWLRLPHVGRVVISRDVKIGANCTVDRGSLEDTVLGPGCCLSSNVSISHNVRLGAHTIVAANVMISGSAHVGDNVWLAPSTVISNGITVGRDAMTGLGAVVVDDVPEGVTVAGSPARILGPRRHFLAPQDDPGA